MNNSIQLMRRSMPSWSGGVNKASSTSRSPSGDQENKGVRKFSEADTVRRVGMRKSVEGDKGVRKSVPILQQLTGFWSRRKATTRDAEGNTSLHWEVFKKQCDEPALRALLESGAEVDALNNEGLSALHLAACVRSQRAVELVVAYHADLEIQDPDGHTALHWAVKRQCINVVKVLIKSRANLNCTNKMGYSVLHEAAGTNNLPMLEVLLRSGVSTGTQTLEGHTPLHWATMCGHVEAVEMLIRAGSNPNSVSKAGHTPLYLAMRSDHDGCIDALKKAGANMDAVLKLVEHHERASRDIMGFGSSVSVSHQQQPVVTVEGEEQQQGPVDTACEMRAEPQVEVDDPTGESDAERTKRKSVIDTVVNDREHEEKIDAHNRKRYVLRERPSTDNSKRPEHDKTRKPEILAS